MNSMANTNTFSYDSNSLNHTVSALSNMNNAFKSVNNAVNGIPTGYPGNQMKKQLNASNSTINNKLQNTTNGIKSFFY